MNTDAGLGNWEDKLCAMKEAFDITTKPQIKIITSPENLKYHPMREIHHD